MTLKLGLKKKPASRSVMLAVTPTVVTAPRKFIIYHNPRCNKSREALDRLRKAGVEPKIVEYLKTPIQPLELDKLLKQMGLPPEKIVRRDEDRFIDLELGIKPPRSRNAWVKILADNPVLIERPIITDGTLAVLGRPVENVDKFF